MMRRIADTEAMHYAVLDEKGRVIGRVALDSLKKCLADLEMGAWLLAADLMEPVRESVPVDTPLAEAVQRLRDAGLEAVPVVSGEDQHYEGMLELRTCEKYISREFLRLRQQSETEETCA
jgi:CBS-domain-containing membrane protein